MREAAAAALLRTRHNLAVCISVIYKILPFIPEISEKAQQEKAYRFFNAVVNIVDTVGFTRMVRGAHFLTDVSLGAIIGMLFFLFALGVLRLFEKKNILPIKHLKINKERKRDGYEKIFK